MQSWLEAFVVTQLIEVPIYMTALRGRFLAAFGASLFTHPFVWFVFPHLPWWPGYAVYFIVAESFAVGFEALYLRLLGVRRFWLWALAANAFSAGAGLLLRNFFR